MNLIPHRLIIHVPSCDFKFGLKSFGGKVMLCSAFLRKKDGKKCLAGCKKRNIQYSNTFQNSGEYNLMKLWLLSILLIFAAATGCAQCLSGVCGVSASAVILRNTLEAKTVASVPYSYLQDMIQPESVSQANSLWKRLFPQYVPAGFFFCPELSLPPACGRFFPRERTLQWEAKASFSLSAPPRAGPGEWN